MRRKCPFHLSPNDCVPCWVYVVGDRDGSGPFKVGLSKNVTRRVAQHRKKTGRNLAALFRVETSCEFSAIDVERDALDALTAYREHGDWFNCDLERAVEAVSVAHRRRK